MSLTLEVLGCDGSYPGPGGAGSGYLVSSGATTVLLEAGPGVLSRLQREISLDQIDAIIVSHEHPDHRGDLDGIAVAIRFGDVPLSIPLYGPRSALASRYFSEWEELEAKEVADGAKVVIGDLVVRFSRTDHDPETLACRIDSGGASLAYSADTGPQWSFEALGPGVDLALCEATWTADGEGRARHLSGRQAGELARAAGVRRLVVTHRWPTIPASLVVAEATASFGAPVETARDGARFVIDGP
jgi:ribonuclease BN (tRNA processing enzyme)